MECISFRNESVIGTDDRPLLGGCSRVLSLRTGSSSCATVNCALVAILRSACMRELRNSTAGPGGAAGAAMVEEADRREEGSGTGKLATASSSSEVATAAFLWDVYGVVTRDMRSKTWERLRSRDGWRRRLQRIDRSLRRPLQSWRHRPN